MKKFLSLFIFILVLPITQCSYANNSEKENFENTIYKLKKDVWKNWEIYKDKVLNSLEKYKAKYKDDSKKWKILDYTISQVEWIKFKYWITNKNSPILYTYKFSDTFYWTWVWPVLDEYEQIDPVQSVLFSWTTVIIEDELYDKGNLIYKIQVNEIPWYFDSYIDARFLEIYDKQPSERVIIKPLKEEIINRLKLQVGHQYIRWWVMPWWVPTLENYYKSNIALSYYIQNKLILKWFDCSWLLHYATNWFTPRNTWWLVYFWTWLQISWLDSNQLVDKFEPLDIIVWRWHVMIILDKENLIESRLDYNTDDIWFDWWVRIRKIKPILDDLVLNKIWVDNYDDKVPDWKKKFTIRRWYK